MADSFAQQLAAALGLDPRVTQAWDRAEGGPSDNPLNLGPYKHFSDPVGSTAKWLSTGDTAGYYKGILAAKTPQAQVAAIKASPFDSSHYANGVLDRTAAEEGITGTSTAQAPAQGRAYAAMPKQKPVTAAGLSPAAELGLSLSSQVGQHKGLAGLVPSLLKYNQEQVAALPAESALPQASASPSAGAGPAGSSPPGSPLEAFYDPLGSFDPQSNPGHPFGGAIGGHSDHVHISGSSAQEMLAAIQLAQKMGLNVGENPYVGNNPDPGVHVSDSFHYRTFPGKYNGKTLGEAIDVSGPPATMAAFYRAMVPGGPKS